MRKALTLASLPALLLACGSPPPPPAPPKRPPPISEVVFDAVAPSVVAILNDDRADQEAEMKEVEKNLGDESHAPKKVIDVSLRKEPMPHGTGFMVEGGTVVTAAHVVMRPDRLKITTRSGQTVDAELVRIDEVRDVAILKPKTALPDVPPLPLEAKPLVVGEPVWALGHTGQGVWALSWGMSAGISSGVVDMFGEKLLLFDAAVYPGFSGGPVVTLDEDRKPHVVGVNHAILFTGGGFFPVASISSAVSVTELQEVVAGHPPAVEATMAAYAQKQRARVYADLFITDRFSVGRDPNGQQTAEIFGNARLVPALPDDARIPVVAMLFGLPKGQQTVALEVQDPNGAVIGSATADVTVEDGQRVSFASATLHAQAKANGRHAVVVKKEGKEVGRAFVSFEISDSDNDDLVDDVDPDAVDDDGDPDVDVVVANLANDDPLMLAGIRAGWAERSYPRRVGFAWFARGSRGWSGTNASITAYVLDDEGHIVGRSDGCFQPELRPEHTWSCMNGGTLPHPLTMKEGKYDIVFAINERPVAWWPMEAVTQKDQAPGSDVDRFLKEMRRRAQRAAARGTLQRPTPPPPPPDPKDKKKPKAPAPPKKK